MNDLLAEIRAFWLANRCPPTLRELQMLCGISSTSVVVARLRKLEAAGLIEKRRRYKRHAIIPSDLKVSFES